MTIKMGLVSVIKNEERDMRNGSLTIWHSGSTAFFSMIIDPPIGRPPSFAGSQHVSLWK